MKLYERSHHVPQTPPQTFTMYEINALKQEADKKYLMDHPLLKKSYEFLMEYEEGKLKWETMSEGQRRWLWAIKKQSQSLAMRGS